MYSQSSAGLTLGHNDTTTHILLTSLPPEISTLFRSFFKHFFSTVALTG